jgi:hypothetical protein
MSKHYFWCSGGTGADSTKSTQVMLRRTCVFASSQIYRPRCAFWCVWVMKHRRSIFHALVGPVWIPQKHARTCHTDHVFLHPVGSVGHLVHSGTFGARNIAAQFLMLGWDLYGFHKKHVRTSYTEFIFLHPVGCVGQVLHSGASEVMWKHYFDAREGPVQIPQNACQVMLHGTCVFASSRICV